MQPALHPRANLHQPVSVDQQLAMRPNVLLRSEWSISAVFALTFLPWIIVVLFTAGAWAALNLLGYAIVVTAAGYCLIYLALPAPSRSAVVFLAPAAGILAISAISAFWVRLGLPLLGALVLWLALAIAGGLGLWRDRDCLRKERVAYGLALTLLSAVICAVQFLPATRSDLVLHRDGSYEWGFKDTQFYHALAASIRNSGSPPTTPGTATAELLYHFGPYTQAAAISRLDGLDLGDAVARVTRGASIWALVLSCFGVGTLLALRATGTGFGGIMTVAGLFFYGSLLALFSDVLNGSNEWSRTALLSIPNVYVPSNGGPFIHVLQGHSVLHGLGAITAILGLCLVERTRESALRWQGVVLLALPALAVPVNSVVALYCLGAVGILLFWGRLRQTRAWLPILLMLVLFFVAWRVMGYSHSPDVAKVMFKHNLAGQWWMVTVWFLAGLGLRLVAFRWIRQPWKDPMAVLVPVTVVGLLGFSLLLQLWDGNERYGIYFLQSIISIFAFPRLSPGWWHGAERSRLAAEWLSVAKAGMLLMAALGIVFAAGHLTRKLILVFLLFALLAGISALMQRSRSFAAAGSAVLMSVLMVGFLAWSIDWYRYGIGRIKTDITYPPGEVRGLLHLRELMAPGERFATNKHALDQDSRLPPIERSYGYSALSERSVLLEGYIDRAEELLPWFPTLLHDNDLLFTTASSETLRDTAKRWRVRWLVARPGTDISLPRPLPAWLVEQPDSGDLKIYRID